MCGLWKLYYLRLFFTSSFAFFVVFLSQYTAIWHLLLYFTVNFFARLVLLCFLGFCCYPSPILLFLVSRCHFFSVWVNETPPESSCWFIFHSLAKFCDFPCNKKFFYKSIINCCPKFSRGFRRSKSHLELSLPK